jgi:hypothetical protein
MNVNEKGQIGLIETIRDLTKKGYECFLPMHDYSPIDLIVTDTNFNTYKIQVKYRTEFRNHIEVGLHSVVNGKRIPVDLLAIDGWAIYCPEVDTVVYINKKEVDTTKRSLTFRLTEGSNTLGKNQQKRKLYSDFTNGWLSSVDDIASGQGGNAVDC